ncbi:MAG: hypothetical protein ABI442_17365 [Gemmatimonadaceae bacterium]
MKTSLAAILTLILPAALAAQSTTPPANPVTTVFRGRTIVPACVLVQGPLPLPKLPRGQRQRVNDT